MPGWIRSFRDVGWDDEGLTNGLQEVRISHPVTFSLWGWAKEDVYRAKSRTMEKLEDRIWNVITIVQHDYLQKTVDSIPGRLKKLVDAAGVYIEFQAMRPFSHLKGTCKNYFRYLYIENIEVMTISQRLLTSHSLCVTERWC